MLKISSVVAALVLLSAIADVFGQHFGPRYESYLCAAHRNISQGFFSCHEDCQLSHGAVGGGCQELIPNRYNCICGPQSGLPPRRVQQCVEPNPGYIELCDMDCKCNHGAQGGRCNYQMNACICEGMNPENYGCPAYTFEHFKLLAQVAFKLKVGKLGPSWLYERFHN